MSTLNCKGDKMKRTGTQSLIARMEIDKVHSRATYKKAKKAYLKVWMKENGDMDLFIASLTDTGVRFQELLNKYKALPFIMDKPDTTGMSSNERKIAYLPYNNGRDIRSLEIGVKMVENVVDVIDERGRVYDKFIDALLELYLDSLRTKYPGENIINSMGVRLLSAFGFNSTDDRVLAGYLVELVRQSGIMSYRRINNGSNKGSSFFTRVRFEDVSELYALRVFTGKDRVRQTIPSDVESNSFIISQKKFNYPQKRVSNALQTALNKKNQTAVCFADWVTLKDVQDVVRDKLYSEKNFSNEWIEKEVAFVSAEFNDIMSNGNRFYIDRFVDSANRIYERKGHIGFQEGSSMRCMLRLAHKHVVTAEGRAEYKAQLDEHYGEGQWQQMKTHEDKWGWLEAYRSRTKASGAIVYDDATSQALGIYGLCTGDDNLLTIGGFNTAEKFKKGYILLAEMMNMQMSAHYQTEVKCFDGLNVKNAFMTTVYNVSMRRVMTGRSGMDEADKMNEMFVEMGAPELVSEFEDDVSRLGKLEPLLMTVRNAGYDIEYEKLADMYQLSARALAREGLNAMELINSFVKNNEVTEIFEWQSNDFTNNQFAMVATEEVVVPWIAPDGRRHSYTDHCKVLIPGSAWRGLAPRIIQSIDSNLMRYVTNNFDHSLVGIHDSFGSHGNFAKKKRDIYLTGCANIFAFDELGSILSQIAGRKVQVQKPGLDRQAIIHRIMNSTNAITK